MVGGLGGLLLTAVVLLVPATVGIFTVRDREGARARGERGVDAVLPAIVVAILALGVGWLLDLSPFAATIGAVVLGASVLVWSRLGRWWAARGVVAWALTVDAGILYLAYVAAWTVQSDLGVLGLIGGTCLWLLEAFVFVLGLGYLWEMVDVLARRRWSELPVDALADDALRPFVSLHVPTHNEPPDLVIATLESLLALEYDDYEVIVVDNNTDDPALWQPVSLFCERHERLRFLHLADWPGYKSGALNEALRVSDPRTEVVGIVDADYVVQPDFLARCAPLFGAADVAFVQTPQDYRDWQVSPYFRRLYHSYNYFFDVSQRSRNERNGAIFGGTMGLIRKTSLEAAGGWDEWCITEDAELSLRLLRAGGRGIHVAESFGRGIMPLTFEALKRQRFRWCFGGIQILRLHWRSLLPGRRTPENQLTLSQRWAYFVGGLQWFGDVAGLLFTAFLAVGALDLAFGGGVVVRRLSGLLLVCVVVLVALGALRALALVHRTSRATWGESLGAFGLWLALGWTVALASVRGLFAREGVFLRTPKVRGQLGWSDAIRGNRIETLVAVVTLVLSLLAASSGGAGGWLLATLLAVQAAGFLAAPLNSLAAIRSSLPDDLRRRRLEMLPQWGGPVVRRGGFVLVAAVAMLAGLVLVASPVGGPSLTDIPEEASGQDERDDRPETERREQDRDGDGSDTSEGSADPTSPSPSGTGGSPDGGEPSDGSPDSPGPDESTVPPGDQPTQPPGDQPTQPPSQQPTQPGGQSPPSQQPSDIPTPKTGKPTDAPSGGGGKPTATPSGGGGRP